MDKQYDEAEIRRLFNDYVARSKSKPRHTKEADMEVGYFHSFLVGSFPLNFRLQNELYNRMMNCAVEFEESGFVAGFMCALSIAQNGCAPAAEEAPPAPAPEQKEEHGPDIGQFAISSKDIAALFECPNWKVVNRIDKSILPHLDKKTRRSFVKVTEPNAQGRMTTYYRLDRVACEKYIDQMRMFKQYVSVTGGISKLRELMDTVFPTDKKPALA